MYCSLMRDPYTQAVARRMRRNPTANEAKLWELLRGHRLDGLKFRRQAPIGRYIADFVCYQRRLIVEADGPHHEENAAHDLARDAWLRDQGFLVLRLPNEMIATDKGAVLSAIRAAVRARAPSSTPGDVDLQGMVDDGARESLG
jgi:very-short-patch-repair endonuclease